MEARKAGVDIFRVFDSLNNVDSIKFGLDAVLAANGVAEGTICYTGIVLISSADEWRLKHKNMK
jgi:pyruvate carboxylase